MQTITINGWTVYKTDYGYVTTSPRGNILEADNLAEIANLINNWAAA